MARAQTLRAVILTIAALSTAAPVLAQSVPLPKSRPYAKPPATKMAAVDDVTFARPRNIPASALVAQAQAPGPISNPFAGLLGKTQGASSQLTPEQKSLSDKINANLSKTQKLTCRFFQVGPDGRKTEGEFYMSKPGRVRFEYDDPSPIEMIADGESVVVRDRKLATQDVYPLSQTPLRFLLSNRVDLVRDANLKAVYADDVFVTAVVEEHNGIVGTSRLMIMFDAKDMQLKQWTVTDPQGYDTTVAVYNLDTTKTPDPGLFRIDYTRYR